MLARSTVIPHGANSRLFGKIDRSTAREELGIGPSQHVILAVGRLVEKKGFEYLIRAMGELSDPTGHAYIVGDGPLGPELRAMASELTPERVTLLGELDRASLARWYAAADVMVIPSVRGSGNVDSGPVVLMEAMASGCAIVATPVGMSPDIIHRVSGHLVPRPRPGCDRRSDQGSYQKPHTGPRLG